MSEPVVVYEFEVYDIASRSWRRDLRRATLEAIAVIGGVALKSTALAVDASRVDGDGFVETSRRVVDGA